MRNFYALIFWLEFIMFNSKPVVIRKINQRIFIDVPMTKFQIRKKLDEMSRWKNDAYFQVETDKFVIQLWAGETERGKPTSYPTEWFDTLATYVTVEVAIYDRKAYFSDEGDFIMPISVYTDKRFVNFPWVKEYFVAGLGDYINKKIVVQIIKDCERIGRLSAFL